MGKFKDQSVVDLNEVEKNIEAFCRKLAQTDDKNKVWTTREGKTIPYEELEDSHLDAILILFEKGKFKNRKCQHKSLKQEKLKRNSKAGKILYADSK